MKQNQKNQEQPASQGDEPSSIKTEAPRKCSICGGPCHYGCGCEARAAKIETEKQNAAGQVLPVIHYEIDGVALCLGVLAGEIKPGEKMSTIQYEVTCLECQELLKPKAEQPTALKQTQAESDETFRYLKSIDHNLKDLLNLSKGVAEAKETENAAENQN